MSEQVSESHFFFLAKNGFSMTFCTRSDSPLILKSTNPITNTLYMIAKNFGQLFPGGNPRSVRLYDKSTSFSICGFHAQSLNHFYIK